MDQQQNTLVAAPGHLTITGFYAGQPICDAESKTENDAHAVYAPLSIAEYRATRCPACLKAYADSYDPEELDTAPAWVRELRNATLPA